MSVESTHDASMTVEIELLAALVRDRLALLGVALPEDDMLALSADLMEASVALAVSWVEGG